MGKRRKTAKTGDRALYKSRFDSSITQRKREDDDDDVYNEVDRFHNRRDEEFLKLDSAADKPEDDDDGISGREGVLNLGGNESSSSSSSDESSDDSSDDSSASSEEQEEVSSDESVEDDLGDVRDWGRKKSAYYHGDTADLEIGQDEQDAFLEEEAAKEIQAARYEQMDEEDFLPSDDDEKTEKDAADTTERINIRSARDLSKLSKADKRRLLKSHHPELLPLLSHFTEVIKEYNSKTRVVANAVLNGDEGTAEAIGATPAGLQYLVTKSLLQSSTALNVAMYLLLKSEQATTQDGLDVDGASAIESHPVIARLQQLNKLAEKLHDGVESKVDTLSEQLETLVKASNVMGNDDESSSASESSESEEESDSNTKEVVDERKMAPVPEAAKAESSSSEEEESDDEIATNVMNEARFGLRPQEVGKVQGVMRKRRAVPLDFGDEKEAAVSTTLASTINAIEQRSATKSRKKRPAPEMLDEQDNDDAEGVRQGLAMMEAELGRHSSDEEDIDDELQEGTEDDDEDDFYSQIVKKSKAKKEFKKSLYAVAPKYPTLDKEIQGERAISKTIMKNRGLVAHKSKLNRNPRVKKREQYRKALVRRKGHVREVRTDEGHRYGGEETGIKSGLSRSRKLGSK